MHASRRCPHAASASASSEQPCMCRGDRLSRALPLASIGAVDDRIERCWPHLRDRIKCPDASAKKHGL